MVRKKDEHYVDNKLFYSLLCENKKILEEYFKEELAVLRKEINESDLDDKKRKKCENKKIIKLIKESENTLYNNKRYKRIQNELGKIFLNICRGLLTKPNYINYTWDRKNDMTSEATFHMSRYMLLYDVERDNPFAYFTTICNRAFLQSINKWNKYTEKFQPMSYIDNMNGDEEK